MDTRAHDKFGQIWSLDRNDFRKGNATRQSPHCRVYIDMGFYLGIGGLVTDTENQMLRNVVEKVPLEKIVLETDAPYVTPTGAEEKRNSSLNIPIIAQEISRLKGISVEEVESTMTSNARKLFCRIFH